MSIAYFVHELADAAVNKRVSMLETAGRTVTLLGFDRERGGGPSSAPAGAIVLGRTQNQRMLARIGAVLAAIPRAWAARKAWAGAEMLIARNLEMLALAVLLTRLAHPRARIAYECLDIHKLMLGRGPASAVLRALERACMRRCALVVTSSPAFERNYFRAVQRCGAPILLAENKVLGAVSARPPAGRPAAPPWGVAWCGVLRCQRSFALLQAAARAGLARVSLWGAPALDQIPDFHQIVAATPNMSFHGRYQPSQLSEIYGAAHFAWAIDFYEAGGNSDWLLPNRLYESLSFGAAPIAMDGVETANWLNSCGVGVVLPAPLEQTFPAMLAALTDEKYAALHRAVAALAPEQTRFTPAACRAFADELTSAAS